jgi:hypothetical protein
MFAGFAGITGLLAGLFPQFARSDLALLFAGALALLALLALIGDWLDGYPLGRGLIGLILLGALAFSLAFLPVWFAAYYLPAHPDLSRRLFPMPDFSHFQPGRTPTPLGTR